MRKTPRVFFLMNKAHAALSRAVDRRTQEVAGLSSPQHGVLFLLARKDGQTVTELAQALSMRKSSLSGLIDRMVERQFVRRVRAEADGRVVHIHLEEKASALLARTGPLVRKMNADILAPFDADEQDVIARFLTHLAENSEDLIAKIDVKQGGAP